MDARILYTKDKKLWKGRECSHPCCESFAVTQCDGFVGNALDGNICAEPLCAFHRHSAHGMDFCEIHKLHVTRPTVADALPQLSIFDYA